jgi:hypothetical protein
MADILESCDALALAVRELGLDGRSRCADAPS